MDEILVELGVLDKRLVNIAGRFARQAGRLKDADEDILCLVLEARYDDLI